MSNSATDEDEGTESNSDDTHAEASENSADDTGDDVSDIESDTSEGEMTCTANVEDKVAEDEAEEHAIDVSTDLTHNEASKSSTGDADDMASKNNTDLTDADESQTSSGHAENKDADAISDQTGPSEACIGNKEVTETSEVDDSKICGKNDYEESSTARTECKTSVARTGQLRLPAASKNLKHWRPSPLMSLRLSAQPLPGYWVTNTENETQDKSDGTEEADETGAEAACAAEAAGVRADKAEGAAGAEAACAADAAGVTTDKAEGAAHGKQIRFHIVIYSGCA